MRRYLLALGLGALGLSIMAPAAGAEFGLEEFDVTFTGPEGETVTQAGSHPFAMSTALRFEAEPTEEGGLRAEEAPKDIILTQPPGFLGNPTAAPRCSTADFLTSVEVKPHSGGGFPVPSCPAASAVGVVSVIVASDSGEGNPFFAAAYNLAPPPGVAAKLGFLVAGARVTIELGVGETPPYNIIGGPTNITQILEVISAKLVLWGVPADPAHDPLRGICLDPVDGTSLGNCPASIPPTPFLTLPRSCTGPLQTSYRIDSWQHPGLFKEGFTETHDFAGNPVGMSGCAKLGFGPEVGIAPTTTEAESASGLELEIDVADEGLGNPDGIAQADIEATEFAFPPGLTVNPSAAEGLGVCTIGQYEAASLTVKGCPEAAKLGSFEVDVPVLENHTLHGAFYLAQPDDPSTPQPEAENPFDSLLASYLLIRDPELGIFAKLAVEIETDEASGQIIARVKEMPPFPLERVALHLRSGPRAPLITPPTCGTYTTKALLYPSSGAQALKTSSAFKISSGPGGAPCPPGGIPPFAPGFEAGSENSAASYFSPFAMRLTRQDGEQDLTRFSAILPPGESGKIAGLARCPDAQIALAKTKTGRAEQSAPSCPPSSQLGHVLAGAGVGSALTYVPGSLYLAGPYNNDPLSVVAIVPAVAGPFDVGTVVTRVALRLNPTTYRVEVDGAASDPLPHILKGIPVKVRDVRVFSDRPNFSLNPTNCEPFQTAAQIFGSGADPFNPADDVPVGREARYQASSCASLAFKPKLALQLKGPTKRNGHPALHTTITYPYSSGPGYANIGKAVVTLPPSEFIDQAHINNPCTRVQFNAGACPPGSILGTAKATSPLLDEPLEGPVIFRSNGGERKLPDVVIDLHGLFHAVLIGAVDTATPKTNPRIRTTFAQAPDAPVQSFSVDLYGAKKGLLVNNRDLCAHKVKAKVNLSGQNGRAYDTEPLVKTSCKGKKKAKRHARRRHG